MDPSFDGHDVVLNGPVGVRLVTPLPVLSSDIAGRDLGVGEVLYSRVACYQCEKWFGREPMVWRTKKS